MNLTPMGTETVSERFKDIDSWSTAGAVEAMLEAQISAVAAVRDAVPEIAAAADAAAARLNDGGRLFYAGAGTSGRIAVQDGVELGPTFGWPADRTAYVLAGGLEATTRSAEGAEDDEGAAIAALEEHGVAAGDVLVAVAASGRTPFTVAAVREANRRGALTIGVANNTPSALLEEAQIGVCAATGSEVVAGSTRMKAGTAQKVILNLFSTAMMIRCGRVYQGLMVDMVISNEKLHQRGVAMIAQLAKVSAEEAETALRNAEDDIKLGVLLALGADRRRGRDLLATANGVLRDAVDQFNADENSKRIKE